MVSSEELDFTREHIIKRRSIMEAQGGAEVRRLHIIYFLSRKGSTEHPHLIRVHHLSRNGIRLRDVKRWLAELRGKDMPESFAWSYKRRYKTGYVWQDLVDDDLITPISDNEYVLKGSEICSIASTIDKAYSEKQASTQKETSCEEDKNKSKEEKQENFETPIVAPRKSSSEIEEEFPNFGSETSTLTDDSMKIEEDKHDQDRAQQQENIQENDKEKNNSYPASSSLYSNLLKKKTKKKKKNANNVTMEKSKSYSNGKSHIFRNLITCGAVDTHDSAMVTINRGDNKPSSKISSNINNKANNHSAQICKREKLGGSERIFGTPWNRPEVNDARKSCDGVTESMKFCSPRTSSSAAFMPVNGPTCSQCGKQFKPEKLHRHMQSCKGMKALPKGMINPTFSANAAENASQASTQSSHEHSISGYFLTH